MLAGSVDEAMAATTGLIEAAEATGNPYALSFALLAYGLACRDADPLRALDSLRRGLVIAQDSGSRANESLLAVVLAALDIKSGDLLATLDHVTLAIHNFHDSGNTISMPSPLAILTALLDRLGRYESAATIAGSALSPITAAIFPELTAVITHLRDVLGDQTYESLARTGETMTTASMVTYAYDQIDQARVTLTTVQE